jgi:DNA-binding transcriptional ArsR family regulator
MSLKGTSISESLAPSENSSSLPRDEVFEVLSNERRRCALHYLKQHDRRRVELRELVDHVTAWENDTSTAQIDSTERKRVYTALRQNHLPKLEEAGIIEYEHMRGEVELTDDAREVQMYLEFVPSNDIPWSEYYLGLSAVGAALAAAVWLGVYPFVELSGLGLAVILVVLFAVSAAVHTYDAARNRIGSEKYETGEE